jgi:hypothetical protein
MTTSRRFTVSLLGLFIGLAGLLLLAPAAAGDSDWPPAPGDHDVSRDVSRDVSVVRSVGAEG